MSYRSDKYRLAASRGVAVKQRSPVELIEDFTTQKITLPDGGQVHGEPNVFPNVRIPYGRLDEIASDYAGKLIVPQYQKVGVYMRQHGVSQLYDLEFYFI